MKISYILSTSIVTASVFFAWEIGQTSVATGAEPQDRQPVASEKDLREKTASQPKGRGEASVNAESPPVPVAAIPEFVHKALGWLVEAQHSDGGWGGGSHARQQERDPQTVPTDPATTAFTAMALLRAGHTPESGDYKNAVRRATEYLVTVVESASDSGPKITDITGTQPQTKLGPMVDTSMTAMYLARVLPTIHKDAKLRQRVDVSLEKCLRKLEASQQKDGSWNLGGGWAPVLQSSLSCTALELAQVNGKTVKQPVLDQARRYQKGNINAETGKASATAAAGVELYAFSGGYRANAADASAANKLIQRAKQEGKLEVSAEPSVQNLQKIGVEAQQAKQLAGAAKQNAAQIARLNDEQLLAGFGNNGGEEFLSYMLTSESLVIAGGEGWSKWNGKMHDRLAKVQNPDGSWSGHHCITNPVFCTAAAVQCLTTDRDAPLLAKVATKTKVSVTK